MAKPYDLKELNTVLMYILNEAEFEEEFEEAEL